MGYVEPYRSCAPGRAERRHAAGAGEVLPAVRRRSARWSGTRVLRAARTAACCSPEGCCGVVTSSRVPLRACARGCPLSMALPTSTTRVPESSGRQALRTPWEMPASAGQTHRQDQRDSAGSPAGRGPTARPPARPSGRRRRRPGPPPRPGSRRRAAQRVAHLLEPLQPVLAVVRSARPTGRRPPDRDPAGSRRPRARGRRRASSPASRGRSPRSPSGWVITVVPRPSTMSPVSSQAPAARRPAATWSRWCAPEWPDAHRSERRHRRPATVRQAARRSRR